MRLATNQQNHANRPKQANNTSGFKGVTKGHLSRAGQTWLARITVSQKSIHLGSFLDPEKAAAAYDVAAEKFFGNFARGNFLEGVA